MTNLVVRVPFVLRARLKEASRRHRKTVGELVRELLEASLDREENGTGEPFTMSDLKKLERVFVAIFAIEQMVVRSLDPHRSLLPQAGQKAIDLTAELLGTKRS
ncbi:MAG TPA: hypothetical protein P5117_05230 [Spirochaetia bacterium]|nr:hypothetical protein [Verrucomicrobiota bacterium]HRZ88871.1 hypothetical protein [Spirochaetia bacterium]